ncbi:MAG TPA: hypothetical protein VFN39_12450, partial [Gemmatimonadaceae bacterium]|nr:hypothetical protein [Gemmatimonadaceae bacterium]
MTIDRRGFLVASASAAALAHLDRLPALPDGAPEPGEGIEPPARSEDVAGSTVTVYTTADQTEHRLAATDTVTLKHMGQPLETQVCVFVDPAKRAQTILGIGGALTDASAETYAKLPADKQRELMDAYYHPAKGIAYTLGRTNIHSCDFSSASYTYVDEGDAALKSFSV